MEKRHRAGVTFVERAPLPGVMGRAAFPLFLSFTPRCLAVSFLCFFQHKPVCSLKTSAVLKGSFKRGLSSI